MRARSCSPLKWRSNSASESGGRGRTRLKRDARDLPISTDSADAAKLFRHGQRTCGSSLLDWRHKNCHNVLGSWARESAMAGAGCYFAAKNSKNTEEG